jgi:hypothetical protein
MNKKKVEKDLVLVKEIFFYIIGGLFIPPPKRLGIDTFLTFFFL